MDYANLFYPDSVSWGRNAVLGYYIGDPGGDYAFFEQSGHSCTLVHARPEQFRESVVEALGRLDYLSDRGNALVEYVAQDLGESWGLEHRPRVVSLTVQ
ncbi:MAG: hypothetical protein U1E29_16020 [Coriobacteriia bacterium]|nr:hypothetical protein [Coriobacteriia bacterium]